MSSFFTARLAGLDIGIFSRYSSTQSLYGDYLSEMPPVFSVRADIDAVKQQMACSDEPMTEEYAESLQLYREIAELLPLYDRIVFHGAAIEYEGKAFLFAGSSGIGKSTHIALWRQYLGDRVRIINGDKPILHIEKEKIMVYGTPYAGKEGWQCNCSAPLSGICFLTMEGEKKALALSPETSFLKLYTQTYKPKSKDTMLKTIELIRKLSYVPCFTMARDKNELAVKASFEVLTGKDYLGNK